MKLAALVDLEAQLAQDAGADPEALHVRDRALVAEAPAGARPHALLVRWLSALRAQEPQRAFPGRRVAAALRTVAALLVVLGLALGWSAASVVLLYEGAQPVNVWDVLLVFVGVQLLLLALLLVSFVFPVGSLGVPLLGGVRWLVRRVWRRLAFGAGERGEAFEAVARRLRARHRLYSDVEAWSLLGLTQIFGVAFNVGALLAFLRLVVFSDLAFSWSTTLEVEPAAFHRLVEALAAPFGWLVPDAVPSAALVEATRWSRLEHAYVAGAAGEAAGAVRAGGWWPFLALSLVTYGLLPRLVTLVVARLRRAWLLAHLPFDDVEVRAVLGRLTRPVVSTRGEGTEAAAGTVPGGAVPRPGRLAEGGGRCTLLLWRDIPRGGLEAAVAARLGCAATTVGEVGGPEAPALGPLGDPEGAAGPVVVAAEAWEAPDDAVLELLADIRRRVGTRTVVVLLTGAADAGPTAPDPGDVALWSRRLARLADPHLALEPYAPEVTP